MSIVFVAVAALFALLLIIVLHELGHFWAAKSVGIRVLCFSVGFGKPLWKYISRAGTEYRFSAIPLGGYVKMLGESDNNFTEAERPYTYQHKPLWARMFVVSAGPIVNFILAFVLFWVIFCQGVAELKPIVAQPQSGTAAAQVKLPAQSEIIAVNGHPVQSWQDVMMRVITRDASLPTLALKIKLSPQSATTTTYALPLAGWQLDPANPDFLRTLGLAVYQPPVPPIFQSIVANSPADKAGLKPGDRLVALNTVPVVDWIQVVKKIEAMPDQKVVLRIARQGQLHEAVVTLGQRELDGKKVGLLGAMVVLPPLPNEMVYQHHYGILAAAVPAFQKVADLIWFNLIVIKKMITGAISYKALGGPVTIVQGVGKAVELGWVTYLSFVAFISATVGFINLLPIPGLDGGHLFFQILEALRGGRPVPDSWQIAGMKFGFALLITVMIVATYNDIMRLLH